MAPLSSIEIKLCQAQAKIFEASVKKANCSLLIFIRRFMFSSIAKSFDDKLYLYQSNSIDDVFNLLDEEFGKSNSGKIKYNEAEMYWIGYIYRCIAIKYNLSSKNVFKLFNGEEIIKYYSIGHTFDIVQIAIRMMENINYDNTPLEIKAYKTMKRLLYTEKLKSYINE